jgi:hypothetical protein
MLLQMLPDTLYFYSEGKLHWGWGINHAATVFFYSFGNQQLIGNFFVFIGLYI